MAHCKCKMCGGKIEIVPGTTVATCEYCGTEQTIISADDEKRVNLFNRANTLRLANEFDKALATYESILVDFPNEAEAHWGICLCRYGIEYVEDPADHKRIPTCHRTSYTSIFNDIDYKETIKNADVLSKKVYQEEATKIDNIQKSILALSQKEDPFDIFICYKETDEDGNRTKDSVIAQQVYDALTDKGYKVFFARITLESKLGTQYEPIIFAALNSAKIMLAIGTTPEHFNAVWVKNEWSRFLGFMKASKGKYLIPCYKDMEAYDMPEEFLPLQAQNMNNLGFLQDLIRGIDKIFGKTKNKQNLQQKAADTKTNNLLTRAFILMNDKDFEKADEILEEVLNEDATNAKAYFGKFLVNHKIPSETVLKHYPKKIDINDKDFSKALKFADEEYKNNLLSFNDAIEENLEKKKLLNIYNHALAEEKSKNFDTAIKIYSQVQDFRDSKQRIEACREVMKQKKYDYISNLIESNQWEVALECLEDLGDYKDSKQKAEEIKHKLEEAKMNLVYNKAYAKAKSATSHDSYDQNLLNEAIKEFETLKTFRDSDKLILKFKNDFEIMTKIITDEKIKREEERKLREEANLKAIKEKQEHDKLVKAKIIFWSKILTPVLILIIGLIIFAMIYLVPMSNYNKAMTLFNEQKYSEIIELLENNNYSNAKSQLQVARAGECFQSGDYENGIRVLYDAGGTINVSYNGYGGSTPSNTVIKHKFITEESKRDGYRFAGWDLEKFSLDNENYVANLKLRAKWVPIDYKISYIFNGGNYVILPNGYNIEESITIPNIVKKGYTFVGWKSKNDSKPMLDYKIKRGTFGDLELVAYFEANTYTITFDVNGGNELPNKTLEVKFDSHYKLPEATKDGYRLTGWYCKDSNFKFVKVEDEGIWTKCQNITLKAQWALNEYDIRYELNGGNEIDNPTLINYNDKITLKNPTKTGYTFLGWTGSNGEIPQKDLVLEKVTSSLDLIANWKGNEYEIVLDVKDGDPLENNILKVNYGSEFTLPVPTRTGYTFLGWYLNDYNRFEAGVWDKLENISLYAKWEITDFKIIYKLNGGINNTYNPTGYNYNSEDIKVIVPTRTGYTFLGWTTDKITEPTKNFVISKNSLGNLTLIANWEANTYKVTFDINGGNTIETVELEVVFDSEINLPIPTRTGYEFVGWNDGYTSVVSGKWKIASDTTLTAKWTANPYEITIENGEESLSYIVNYDQDFSLKELTKENFEFIGYFTKPNCDGEQYTDELGKSLEPYTLTSNLTLYPGFKYSVTYISNGGSDVAKEYYLESENIKQETVATKEGMTFGGWYTDELFETEIDYTQIGNIIVYAKWNEEISPSLLIYNDTTDLEITGFKEGYNETTLMIPSHIGGRKVYAIKSNSFANMSNITSVIIPGTVKVIEDGALSGVNTLESLKWNNDVENIKAPVNGLTLKNESYNLSLQGFSLREDGSIYGETTYKIIFTLTAKEYINIDYDYSFYTTTSNCRMYTYLNDSLISEISSNATNSNRISLNKNDVLKIIVSNNSYYSYQGSLKLSNFKISYNRIGNNLKKFACIFGTTQFENSTAITQEGTQYYVPNSLKTIEINKNELPQNYFEGLTMVEKINLPNIKKVSSNLFKGCTNLDRINSDIVGVADLSTAIELGSYSLSGLSKITNVMLGDKLTSIGDYAFADSNLINKINSDAEGEIIIPGTVKTIGDYAFKGLSLITNVVVADSVETIGKNILNGINSLESITLPFIGADLSSVEPFGYLFDGTNATIPTTLVNVVITKDVNIQESAFEGCLNIQKISIPENVETIESSAFSECVSLKQLNSTVDGEINIPSGIKKVENNTFKNCGLIQNVTLASTVEYIGSSAFEGCSALAKFNSEGANEIIIPESCVEIGTNAFKNVSLIEKVTISKNAVKIGTGSFSGVSSVKEFVILEEQQDDVIPTEQGLNLNSLNYDIKNSSFEYVNGILKSINHSSNTVSEFILEAKNDFSISFDWEVSSESSYDIFYLYLNNSKLMEKSGSQRGSYKVKLNTNDVLKIRYYKDGSNSYGNDNVKLWNFVVDYGANTKNISNFASVFGVEEYQNSQLVTIGSNNYYVPLGLSKILTQQTIIKNSYFEGLSMVQTIEIPNVSNISNSAFKNCSSLQNVVISNNVKYIGSSAFEGCSALSKFNSQNENEIVIPTSCKEIGNYAFKNLSLTTNVIISDSVEKVGDYLFSGCTNISKITLPFIGNNLDSTISFKYLFDGSNLDGYAVKEIVITKETTISNSALASLAKIEKITIPTTTTSIGDSAFSGCASLKQLNSSVDGELNIPVGVTRIENNTFNGCTLAQNITMSNNVEYIGSNAFAGCNIISRVNSNNMYEINVPTACTEIGEYAFKDLILIKNVIVPDSVSSIGKGAFKGCNVIEKIALPFVGESETAKHYNAVFGYIFDYTTKTTTNYDYGYSSSSSDEFYDKKYGNVDGAVWQYSAINNRYNSSSYYNTSYFYYIPMTIKEVTITKQTQVPVAAFKGCIMLEKITIPTTTDSIGRNAFDECASLKQLNSTVEGTINIPTSVTRIEDFAFLNSALIQNITMSDNVEYIGRSAFNGCNLINKFNSKNENEINIPTACTEIGMFAFRNLTLITNVIIGDKVEKIGDNLLSGCVNVSKITLPFIGNNVDSESTINSLFGGSNLDGYAIKEIVITKDTTIPENAFASLKKLEKITIPTTTTSIGTGAFKECSSLKQLNSKVDGEINIPTSVTRIQDYTFMNCALITNVTMSNNIEYIGRSAFNGCSAITKFNSQNLNEINVPTACKEIGMYAFKDLILIKNVIVPDNVSSIGKGAFNGCNAVEKMTLPFVGESETAKHYNAVFGYVFDYITNTTTNYDYGHSSNSSDEFYNTRYGNVDGAVWQYSAINNRYNSSSYYNTSYFYYIPTTIKEVTITNQTIIPEAAFNGCNILEKIVLPNIVIKEGEFSYQNCTAIVNKTYVPTSSSIWDGETIRTGYLSGDGSKDNPYNIFDGSYFAYFISQVNSGVDYTGKYFIIGSNINLGNHEIQMMSTTKELSFKGNIIGNHKYIKNFILNGNGDIFGLFGYLSGSISNLSLLNVKATYNGVKESLNAGILAGELTGVLTNCYVDGNLTVTNDKTSYIGLLVGLNDGTINNCHTSGNVNLTAKYATYAAGLVGWSKKDISNSYSSANVKVDTTTLLSYAAGLVAKNEAKISNSFATGNITANAPNVVYGKVAGLVSEQTSTGSIENCYRSNTQIYTVNGSEASDTSNIGVEESVDNILKSIKTIWDANIWDFDSKLPSLK